MILLTYATHSSNYFQVLTESASYNNYKLIVLGMKNKWNGLMDKFIHTERFIQSLPEDEIVIFVDAFDTIVLRPDCLDTFLQIHHEGEVLFSACHSNWALDFLFGDPAPTYKHEYYNSINTGLYMGYVKDLKNLFTKFKPYMVDNENDQRAMNQYHREVNDHIQLDTGCHIFYNIEWKLPTFLSYLYWVMGVRFKAPLQCPHYSIKNKELYVVKTKSSPFFIQGNMNTNMDNIVSHIGLLAPENKKSNYYWYSTFTYITYSIYKLWHTVLKTIKN